MSLKEGSLFSGYNGLGLGIGQVLDTELAWVSDIDKGACKILAHRYPDVPNLGDLTQIDWTAVEPVDIITGGFPCQDLSHAGKRAGMADGTRSGLWSYMCDAINIIRPRLVVAENVRGLLSAEALRPVEPCTWCVGDDPVLDMRALGAVLADLADIGYDAIWYGLFAGRPVPIDNITHVGASHGRFRVFLAAHPRREPGEVPTGWGLPAVPIPSGYGDQGRTGLTLLPTPAAQEPGGTVAQYHARLAAHDGRESTFTPLSMAVQLLPTPRAGDGEKGGPNQRGSSGDFMLPSAVVHLMPTATTQPTTGNGHSGTRGDELLLNGLAAAQAFGQYAGAIARWESVIGRLAPSPTEPTGKGGAHRLSPRFTEWMMGLPEGWITDVPGITRNEALKACGNGVVPQQAAAALRRLLAVSEVAA